MSLPLGSPTSVRITSTACLLSFHAQMASSCIFFTQIIRHSPTSLPKVAISQECLWLDQSNHHAMPTSSDHRGIYEIFHAMPSITELSAVWMVKHANDISDLNLGCKPLICYPLDLVHHARPPRPYGHARPPLLMIIQGLYLFCAPAPLISSGVVLILVLARVKKSWFGWCTACWTCVTYASWVVSYPSN